MTGVTFLGFGKYSPEKIVDNEDFTKIIETSDEWIQKRTGIKQRHVSEGQHTWQMALKAAWAAISDAKIHPLELDMIIVTTVSNDFNYPSVSNILQGKLEAKNAFGMDISCACAGFAYALDMAQRYIATDPQIRTILIVSAENMTKTANYQDRSSCILFGDGAGAAVLCAGGKQVYSYLAAEGESAEKIYSYSVPTTNPFTAEEKAAEYDKEFPKGDGHRLYMDGRNVYKFATQAMPRAINNACQKAGITAQDLTWVVSHQANLRIIETAAHNLGLSMERFFTNIDRYGNTSSASIPICLTEMKQKGLLKKGDQVAVAGFGAGLIYGAAVFTY